MIAGTTYETGGRGKKRRARPVRLTKEEAHWCHYHQNYHHVVEFNWHQGTPRCRQYQREYYRQKKNGLAAATPVKPGSVNSPSYTSPLDRQKICLKCDQPYTLRQAREHRLECGISKEVPTNLLDQTVDIAGILAEDLEKPPKEKRRVADRNWRPGWLKGKHP